MNIRQELHDQLSRTRELWGKNPVVIYVTKEEYEAFQEELKSECKYSGEPMPQIFRFCGIEVKCKE